MKLFYKITFLIVLMTAAVFEAPGKKEDLPTIKEQMEKIHLLFNMNFIYDSSISLDVPTDAKPDPESQTLEECLETLFKDTDISWEVHKRYIILTHKDRKRKPKDYTIFIEEQRDTLNESRITALTGKDRNITQTGFKRLDKKKFDMGFAVLSSPDVIKTLQQLPGVATGTELLSGMYVRGGDGADNLYLLDGVSLYQVSHLLGLFSSFNTDVVESLDFYKSGFPARYGGRLSSVVDVRTRDGDYENYHGLFSIGLLDGRFQFEGPIVKGKTSFNIGLRRSWLDLITEPVSLIISRNQERNFRIKYAFWDMNAKLTHKFSEKSKLSLDLYGGRDAAKFISGEGYEEYDYGTKLEKAYYNDAAIGLEWGNFVSQVNWHYGISEEHELALKAYFSKYSSLFSFKEEIKEGALEEILNSTYKYGENRSRTSDVGFKADFSLRAGEKHHIRYGAGFQYHIYSPDYYTDRKASDNGNVIVDQHLKGNDRRQTYEPSAYIEDEIAFTDRLTANIGLRYSVILADGAAYHSLQPRAALRFGMTDNTSLKLSYSEMVQNDHQIASNYLQLPTNFWMPSTSKIAPGRSRQVSGGIYSNLPHNIRFGAEGYFKTMDNLLEFRGKWGIYPPIHLWEEAMVTGKGRSWGIESELEWSDEKTSLAAYYTLSWSQRYFEEFYPDWYRDRNDNRHKLTLAATRKLGKRCEVYGSWNFHSGGYMTAEAQSLAPDEIGVWPETFYTMPNNIKLPDYHRLDVGFNFRKTTKRGNESIWNLSIYNVYCHMNPFISYIDADYEFTKDNLYGFNFIGEAFGIIPILPSFSYTLKF
jgi:hypothetical protein